MTSPWWCVTGVMAIMTMTSHRLCQYLVRLSRAPLMTQKAYLAQEMIKNRVAWPLGTAVTESSIHILISCLGAWSKKKLQVYLMVWEIPAKLCEVCLLWESHYSVNQWLGRWDSSLLTPWKIQRVWGFKSGAWQRWKLGDLKIQSLCNIQAIR